MADARAGSGRPTKARAAAMTEALLDTARALFCARGFAGTSIVAAGWPVAQADEACAILVDLLDGEANRVKWAEASGDGVEARFERRWQTFLLAARPFTD